jgi:hypothetical protein
MSLRGRLARLERHLPTPGGACPHCPPGAIVLYQHDDPTAAPVLVEGQFLPAPCLHCGREPPVLAEVLVVVDGPEGLARVEEE